MVFLVYLLLQLILSVGSILSHGRVVGGDVGASSQLPTGSRRGDALSGCVLLDSVKGSA